MASLLPKNQGDFAKREYWDKFFSSRKSTFEWYGDFVQHSTFFHKYLKKSDDVLIVGCGNSELGAMICDRIGCASVLNIDTSEALIRQMRKRYCQSPAGNRLRYECMDVLKLTDCIEEKKLNPFTCVIDKGTLDAIHSGDQSERTVRCMFDNIRSVLKMMARYIIITLAQEHIIESICTYFLRESNEWLINCHQLTSNRPGERDSTGDGVFALPVYGFVFTKLMSSPDLPRVSVYPLDSPDPQCLGGGERYAHQLEHQLRSWINQEQHCSLLRHNISSGDQTSFRFTCPRTGLTAFYCTVVRSAAAVRKHSKRHGSHGHSMKAIEAVFLVPFGQHRRSVYSDDTERRSLCRSANVSSLLVALVNPRFFQPDLDSLKEQLSTVLRVLHFESPEGHAKSPILSTPDSYLRRQLFPVSCEGKPERYSLDEIEIHGVNDGKIHKLRRIVYASSDMRPVVTTNAACVGLLDTLPPRDLHLLAWNKLVLTANGLYFGTPPVVNSDNSQYLHAIPVGDVDDSNFLEMFSHLYPNSLLKINWITSLGELTAAEQYDAIFYDPLAVSRAAYRSLFTEDALKALLNCCSTHMHPKGFLIVVMESRDDNNSGLDHMDVCGPLTNNGELCCVLNYTVPDIVMDDPSTTICIFRFASYSRELATAELTSRIGTHRTESEKSNHVLSKTFEEVKTLLSS
ncbi:eEF1A lysine and N-terminal methyltransferase [Clonorchis sinensis]|uniref:EEF1A lysine and N-terminal methyltransferase n=1 Tax=Clonorchis sinensis TaxID=79923 RepID=A0A8T1MJI0_CLOSI|nr:eEF1A lysine and N-terminal methyltransferase [Clonorchis sinensis]